MCRGKMANRIKTGSSQYYVQTIVVAGLLILSFFSPGYGQPTRIHYAGSLHSHSQYSDGNMGNNPSYLRAKPCFDYANQSLYIDFWGISEHNHSGAGMSLPSYRKGILEADSATQNGSFVACYGMEYGIISSGGHVIVYGVDSLIGWETNNYEIFNSEFDYNGLFTKIASRTKAFATLAHMSQTDYSNMLAQPYNPVWDAAICGMAIKSGPAFSQDTLYSDPPSGNYFNRFRDLLAKGYHVAPEIDHDSHYINFGRSNQGRTIIIADSLQREALYTAMKARRFYATDDMNARLEFSVNNFEMGSINNGNTNPIIRAKVLDANGEAVSQIRLYYGVAGNGLQPTQIYIAYNTDSLVFTHITQAGENNYYFIEVVQQDNDRLYSAPIWYTRTSSPSPVVLLNFDGELFNRKAHLTWSTASEQNADYFEVMKSETTNPYSEIGQVNAIGFSTIPSYYQFNDPEILTGPTYYQLKIVNINGDFSYSQPVLLNPAALFSGGLTLFPNPTSGGEVWAIIDADSLQHFEIEIFNAAGQQMLRTEIFTSAKRTVLPLELSHFQSGLYLFRITNMDTRASILSRLIRQ
jgi:trimeric autotransporter adhesin